MYGNARIARHTADATDPRCPYGSGTTDGAGDKQE